MFEQPFPEDEYQARVARVRQEMARHDLDGLLLTSGPNLTYLSGYPSPLRAGSRPFIFLLPQAGEPILIVHAGRELEARGSSWVKDIRTDHALSHAPLPELVAAMHDAGLTGGRIGGELGPEESLDLPVEDFRELQRRLSAVELVPAGPALAGAHAQVGGRSRVCAARLPGDVTGIREDLRTGARRHDGSGRGAADDDRHFGGGQRQPVGPHHLGRRELRSRLQAAIEPGMIITGEPGVATPFGIFHVEENVLVTEQGSEVLSHAPQELTTIAVA